MDTFTGIPAAAMAFYAELEENNNREWWLEHKDVYDGAVRGPLETLFAGLEPEFGPAKIFRPNRDIRFSADKSPYKTAQGAFAANHEGLGYYLQISADGLLVGAGCHSYSPAQLARYRSAVDAPVSGVELADVVDAVAQAGFRIEGEMLKTVPRGFDKEHPRAELLKHKSLSAAVMLGQPGWMDSPAAQGEVAALWTQLRPLVEWMAAHAAP
ncbi:DUF2461 domain-containing protein [Arthrobacter sp. 35W]|uniref:DUF2461 domain-containing protein n=1 Tax=Arthrobacter sp. 35W TaxID=1132441 RepID=UPI00041A80EE|nr:DUF2461 domain-containing protein [Arthrobacter sp. 35W]